MPPHHGELWWCQFAPPDKRRPVVVLTRAEALPYLRTAMVAPITSTIRGIPSEVIVGPDEGLEDISAISLDNVQTVRQRQLRDCIGKLGSGKMAAVCIALAVATGCE